jgi:DNA modification methylase
LLPRKELHDLKVGRVRKERKKYWAADFSDAVDPNISRRHSLCVGSEDYPREEAQILAEEAKNSSPDARPPYPYPTACSESLYKEHTPQFID